MPRYMPAAYPYYASVFITMVGFLTFLILFMFSKDDKSSIVIESKPKAKGKDKDE